MSITAIQVEPASPPVVLELRDELVSTSLRNTEITRVNDCFEPIYGSFKLRRRNGEDCVEHTNGGGLVALTARVQHSVFVAQGAAVLGHSDRHWKRLGRTLDPEVKAVNVFSLFVLSQGQGWGLIRPRSDAIDVASLPLGPARVVVSGLEGAVRRASNEQ